MPVLSQCKSSKTGSCSAEGSQRLQLGHSERSEEASLYHSSGEILRCAQNEGRRHGNVLLDGSLSRRPGGGAIGKRPTARLGHRRHVRLAAGPRRGLADACGDGLSGSQHRAERSGPALCRHGSPPAAFVAEGRTTGPGEPRAPLPGGRAGRQLDRRAPPHHASSPGRRGRVGRTVHAHARQDDQRRPGNRAAVFAAGGGGPGAGRSAAL